MLQSSPTLDQYNRDGYLSPIDVMSSSEAENIRQDLEQAEAELKNDPESLALLRAYPDRLLPSFDELVRHPNIINEVSKILGGDLMVWSAGLFDKTPHSDKIVSWHQDLTYWGLDDVQEVTAWFALSPSTLASGCMKFIPGSHKKKLVPHVDTFSDKNLLTRGQEVAVEVDESDAVAVELQTGQISLHHGHLIHSSGPNTTPNRRVGAAIRYIKPSMKQVTDDKSLVRLVSGEDHFHHFKLAAAPSGRLAREDFASCAEDARIKRKILYAGAEDQQGTRY